MLLLCVLLILVCYIYGCKPNLSPQGLLRYVEYLEKIKLRGIADSFFVEVTIGDSGGKDFCKIALIPSRLGACAQGMSFCYGEIKGSLKKASGKQEYIAVVNYAKAHNFIALSDGHAMETVALFALAEELPAEEILLKAKERFGQSLEEDFLRRDTDMRIHLKIISDMSGNAYYYAGFAGGNKYYAAMYDTVNKNIIADYVK